MDSGPSDAVYPEAEGVNPPVDTTREFACASRRGIRISRLYLILLTILTILVAISSIGLLSLGALVGSALGASSIQAWSGPVVGYTAFFVLPILFSLPVLLPLAYLWREPRRIVAFRRFNIGNQNAALTRLLTRYFAPFGHVFTLADKQIAIPLSVRFPLMLGQLSFAHFRPRKINSARCLARLERLLQKRIWLNVNWFVSRRKIFVIRASDGLWQSCVQTVMERADLALLDISIPSEALTWEMAECLRRDLQNRTLFIAMEEYKEGGKRWLAGIAKEFPAVDSIPLFTYKKGRFVDEGSFAARAARLLTTPMVPDLLRDSRSWRKDCVRRWQSQLQFPRRAF